jgi:hypothetical protein
MTRRDTNSRSRRSPSLLAIPLLIGLLGGCASAPGSSSPPATTGSSAPGTPAPSAASSSPSPSAEPVSEVDIARAVEFRTRFGIRADEAWTRSVAVDPAHVVAYGVPLLPAEEAELNARPRTFEDLAVVLQDYAASHPGEFGGMYVEPPGSQQFVVLFTGHLDDHTAALSKLVSPASTIQLRLTPTAERDLDALMERISGDAGALRAAGIFVVETSRDDVGRVVEVGLSTERPDAPGLLVGRYGPTVVARIIDPTGAYLKTPGSVVGRVVDGSGRGVAAMIGIAPLFAEVPLDAIGRETTPAGTFRIDRMLPGRWRITADAPGFAQGAVEVDVPPGGTATADLVLAPG